MAKRDMESQQPLAIELYAGLHGWGEGLVAEGFRSVGFDIVDMCAELGHARPEGCLLVIQDVTTLHGSQFRDAAVIVASPPCQAYSYRAMPWKRAKALPPPDNTLFEACFRIQREANEANGCLPNGDCAECIGTGNFYGRDEDFDYLPCDECDATGKAKKRYIPLIVENVRGAQKWVGRAKANFGSYYLWGDVGMVGRRVVAGAPRFGVSVAPMKATKVAGLLDGHFPPGGLAQGYIEAQKRNPDGTDHGSGSWFKIADSKNRGATLQPTQEFLDELNGPLPDKFAEMGRHIGQKINGYSDPRRNGGKGVHLTSQRENDSGTKQAGISGERNNGKGDKWFQDGAAKHGSKSNSRKAASAQIARIPFALAQHVAQCFVASYAERLLEKKAFGETDQEQARE